MKVLNQKESNLEEAISPSAYVNPKFPLARRSNEFRSVSEYLNHI